MGMKEAKEKKAKTVKRASSHCQILSKFVSSHFVLKKINEFEATKLRNIIYNNTILNCCILKC